MSEEMKLLKELCNVLGFEVETVIDRKERKEPKNNAMQYNSPRQLDRRLLTIGGGGFLHIDEDGMYTSYLVKPDISYKLTKRESE